MSIATDMAVDEATGTGPAPRRPAPRRTVYLDIETATQSRVLEAELRKLSFLGPEDVLSWCEEHAADDAKNPHRGRVICWALATSDDQDLVMVDEGGDDERELLDGLLSALREWDPPRICTWNGAEFDVPFLRARSLALGADDLARLLWHEKPWDQRVVDLSNPEWFPRPRRYQPGWEWNLDAVAELFGIEREPTTPGGEIPAAWYRREFVAVSRHCLDDVRTLRAVGRRLAAGRTT